MHIFSYIFYTFTKIPSVDDVTASALLSVSFMLNIMALTVTFLGKEYLKYGLAISVIIFVINLIIFNEKMLAKLKKRWDNELNSQRMLKRMLVLLYVALTIATTIMSL